jgi:ferredoxin
MAKITFKKDNIVVDVPAGTSLMKVCDDKGASVQFSCRAGSCLSCVINVESGMQNLSAPTDVEKMTLEAFGCTPNQRLACQVTVNGDVVIS